MRDAVGAFVVAVLHRDQRKRLGEKNGAGDVKADGVFAWLDGDWDALRAKAFPAPHVPALSGQADSSKFDSYPENMDITPFEGDQAAFDDFGGGLVADPESQF